MAGVMRVQAFEDFERASKLEPGNTFLREKIQKAKEAIAAIAQKKKDSSAKYVSCLSQSCEPTLIDMDAFFSSRNIKVNKGVLDWMGDTSLVGLDVEVWVRLVPFSECKTKAQTLAAITASKERGQSQPEWSCISA